MKKFFGVACIVTTMIAVQGCTEEVMKDTSQMKNDMENGTYEPNANMEYAQYPEDEIVYDENDNKVRVKKNIIPGEEDYNYGTNGEIDKYMLESDMNQSKEQTNMTRQTVDAETRMNRAMLDVDSTDENLRNDFYMYDETDGLIDYTMDELGENTREMSNQIMSQTRGMMEEVSDETKSVAKNTKDNAENIIKEASDTVKDYSNEAMQ